MRKIKVAFFADCLIENYDGAIRTMYEIINRIPKGEFEFLFITGDAPQQDFHHEVYEVPSLFLPVNKNYKMALTFPVSNQIKKALNEFGPDVVHIATPSPLGNFGMNYARVYNLPVISIYHTHFISYIDYYLKRIPGLINVTKKILISQMQSFYNQCDLLYVPTNEIRTVLKQVGIFSNHQKIWQRGIDRSMFSPSKRDDNYIQSITLNCRPNILFSSRLVWEKNLQTLIEIYDLAESQGLEYNFIIAGDGYAKNAMKKKMPKAYFLEHVQHEQLSVLYASSDVFLFPSISETYGNVVVEAMASGLPCVVADGGGTKDLIQDGVNGFVCQPYEPTTYLSAIKTLISDQEVYNSFKNQGLSFVANLDWESLVGEYFRDIESLAIDSQLKRA